MKTLIDLTLAIGLAGCTLAHAGELVVNYDGGDPAQKEAFELLIKKFESKHPDIDVQWNLFEHGDYVDAINVFMESDVPDVAGWRGGNSLTPFVEQGLFDDVTDVWLKNGLYQSMAATRSSLTIDGRQWGVPYTHQPWGIYYRADLFASLNIEPPTDWDAFNAACSRLKDEGITPISIGTKYNWPAAAVFDLINLRLNGYQVHKDLTAGKIEYTDDRIREAFVIWASMVEQEFFIEDHAARTWQEALEPVIEGEAAMTIIGSFATAEFGKAGLAENQLDFMPFPSIDGAVPTAELAPVDSFHIPSKARNKDDARIFLTFLTNPDIQSETNRILNQVPVNNDAIVEDAPMLGAAFVMMDKAQNLAQSFERDTPASMSDEALAAFAEFMEKPERLEDILARLDKIRGDAYQ